jgi:PKD repeat protein
MIIIYKKYFMSAFQIKTFINSLIALLMISWMFFGCKPDNTFSDLQAKPKADFAIVNGADANTFILVNTTSSPSVSHWFQYATGQRVDNKDSATMHFTFAGNYDVTLIAAGNGGLDSITKTVAVTRNDPGACNGTAIGFLTGCGTKTWKLNPAAGAYKVGPSGPDDGSWWASTAGDVPGRSCEFNDTYTFTFSASGEFAYDNKGDFYPDGYLGDNGYACESNTQFTSVQQPWGSGNFRFAVLPGGIRNLGQLKLIGLGAHVGLQKVNNGGEITSGPVNAITYDIVSMTHDAAGNYDILKLAIYMPSNYWWTFTLRSF